MNTQPTTCVIYSADRYWSRRLAAELALHDVGATIVSDRRRLFRKIDSTDRSAVVVDLLSPDSLQLIRAVRRHRPGRPVIACGKTRTSPFVDALQAEVFAVMDRSGPIESIASVIRSALTVPPETLPAAEPACARDTAAAINGGFPATSPADLPSPVPILRNPTPEAVTAYLEAWLQGIAARFGVLRSSLFLKDPDSGEFTAAIAINCTPEIRETRLPSNAALPTLLEKEAVTLTPDTAPPKLAAELTRLGAELVVPLLGDEGLIGWACLSQPVDGSRWHANRRREIAGEFVRMAGFLAQSRQAQTIGMLEPAVQVIGEALASGLIAVDDHARIIFINQVATRLLDLQSDIGPETKIEALGTAMADMVYQALAGNSVERRFTVPGRPQVLILAQVLPVVRSGRHMAIAVLREIIPEVSPEEAATQAAGREAVGDEDILWEQVAEGIAHQIRNPLVAIKTFAQLLPERYEDPDFRKEFGELVNREIERLNGLLNSIAALGRPLQLDRRPVDIHVLIKRGLNTALVRNNRTPLKKIEVQVPDHLPRVSADEGVLTEAFVQLFTNAIEAASQRETPQVRVSVQICPPPDTGLIGIQIEDNGPGIPQDIQKFVFSPFCSTKAHRMGFGLWTARRAIRAHGGSIEIGSSRGGTRIFVKLPFVTQKREPMSTQGRSQPNEEQTSADRG